MRGGRKERRNYIRLGMREEGKQEERKERYPNGNGEGRKERKERRKEGLITSWEWGRKERGKDGRKDIKLGMRENKKEK